MSRFLHTFLIRKAPTKTHTYVSMSCWPVFIEQYYFTKKAILTLSHTIDL